MSRVPLSKISMGDAEIRAVADVIESGWVSSGDLTREFEKQFAAYVGTRYALAVSSGFSALFAVLKCAGITGDVILPSFTFGASANAVALAGGNPVFTDVDPQTRNVTAETIEACLTPSTQAVMVVHFGGLPCDMDPIIELADRHGLLLVEDSAQTLGATYRGRQAGSFGVGCFSFFATKNISTGEGGMITTDDAHLYDRLRLFVAHGISKEREASWQREVSSAGMNLRMSQIAAALGRVQLGKLEDLNNRRKKVADEYTKRLGSLEGVALPFVPSGRSHVYQMYTVLVDSSIRNSLVEELKRSGVEASVHFDPPVHRHACYQENSSYPLPHTERLAAEIVTLPMYPDMTVSDVEYVTDRFEATFTKHVRGATC